jgi:hypothetical protein
MCWRDNVQERSLAERQKPVYAGIIKLCGLWHYAERMLTLPLFIRI